MKDHSKALNAEKALIWRIVHISTMTSILDNGLYCRNHTNAPTLTSIGNQELISRRATHPVPISPFGFLNDYIPFYFTPFSPMLLNIKTGRGVPQRPNEEIVILVSSLHHIQTLGLNFVFSNMHAYYQWANFYNNLNDLIDIEMLVDYDKQSIRKNLDNTYLSAQIERLKKEIESIENRNPKITKEYLEKKIMIYLCTGDGTCREMLDLCEQ